MTEIKDYSRAIQRVLWDIEKEPLNLELYRIAQAYIHNQIILHKEQGVKYSVQLKEMLDVPLSHKPVLENIKDFYQLRNNCLLLEAPYLLDSYCQYLEINRPLNERFYLPRRKTLKKVVDLLQELADGEKDEIFVSMPPRVGKTTILMFFITWVLGRNSELANLYCAYSDTITNAFYKGVLEIIKDPETYTWNVIFRESRIADTDAKQELLDIDRKKRYSSLTCRSLSGTLNGACDCNGYLIADDLISGIEEALSRDRLRSAWDKVSNNLLTRAKTNSKIIWVGTRWSIVDPIGIRLDLLEHDPHFANTRWQSINLPALDERDESNFNYSYGVGFSTDDFKKKRASFEKINDTASWMSQYMGQPIEREGTLFTPQDLKYFNGSLPEVEPDRIFMVVDVAFGGGDFLSAPVCYQYGDEIYIVDWVFDPSDKSITRPKIVSAIIRNGVQAINFERNNGGGEYKDFIQQDLSKRNYKCNITTTPAPQTKRKEMRIFDHAPEIREFYFLDDALRNKDYQTAMQNLFSFRLVGKNKNDDAPDSLAQVCEFMANGVLQKPIFFKRLF